MDDRELLELAARAAGIDAQWKEWRTSRIGKFGCVEHIKHEGMRLGAKGWSPLEDDGDALRLAVKLELIVGHDAEDRLAYAQVCYPYRSFNEFYGGTRLDACAAMRRAIVAAAAAIAQETTDAQG